MNYGQFNQEQFNQDHSFAEVEQYPISFNGYNLASLCSDSVGIMLQTANPYDVVAEIASFASSIANGGTVVDKTYPTKTMNLTFFIQGTSNDDLIARIEDLKKNTQGIEGFLDFTIAGSVRRYEATIQSVSVPAFNRNVDFLEGIEMSVLITSPFWHSIDLTAVYIQNKTADFSKVVTNAGTFETFPIVQLITNAGSTLSAISIEMKDVGETVGYTVGIVTAIPPSSVVIFDFINKVVTVNDTEVNFTGIMMPMPVGQSVFTFDLTGTIDVNAYILHYPTFI